jgi:hypothetical protein
MATYIYEGETEVVFPSIGITVKSGETFEAPEGFAAQGVSIAKNSTKTAKVVVEETAEAGA